jgi:hypothetical protein
MSDAERGIGAVPSIAITSKDQATLTLTAATFVAGLTICPSAARASRKPPDVQPWQPPKRASTSAPPAAASASRSVNVTGSIGFSASSSFMEDLSCLMKGTAPQAVSYPERTKPYRERNRYDPVHTDGRFELVSLICTQYPAYLGFLHGAPSYFHSSRPDAILR